jgi:hypothetical protein
MWIGILIPKLMMVRPFLPSRLRRTVDLMLQPEAPSKKQMDRITALGLNLGLSEEDVVLALDNPAQGLGQQKMSRVAFVVSAAVVVVAAAIIFIGIWHAVSPETSPIPTYAPGTFYGTIKPQDFTS